MCVRACVRICGKFVYTYISAFSFLFLLTGRIISVKKTIAFQKNYVVA